MLRVSTSVLHSHLFNCHDPNCEIAVSARYQVSKPQAFSQWLHYSA